MDDFHMIWREQCAVTPTIRKRFGVKSALDYLVGQKLLNYAKAADEDPDFAAELPRFILFACVESRGVSKQIWTEASGEHPKLARRLYRVAGSLSMAMVCDLNVPQFSFSFKG